MFNGSYELGRIGQQAFQFNGSNQFVSVPDDSVWNLGSGTFTISMWANMASIRTQTAQSGANALIAHDTSSGSANKWAFEYLSTGQLVWHINSPSLGPIFLTSPNQQAVSVGQWNLFSVTKSGNTYTFYENATSLGTVTDVHLIPAATAPLTIGVVEGLGWFDGRIQDVRVYDQALSASDIAQLINVPEPEPTVIVSVEPNRTYLKPVGENEIVSMVYPTQPWSLAANDLPVSPGEYLRIQAIGEFKFGGPGSETTGPYGDGTLRDAYGIFSSSDQILSPGSTQIDHVPDKLQVTEGHFQDLITAAGNDVPFDFSIPNVKSASDGAIVRVPAGATHLLLSAADSVWYDNTVEAGKFFGVRITRLNPARQAGDFNFDGIVDAADYVVWRNASGSINTDSAADANLDGKVDEADYQYWRSNFGSLVAASSSSSTFAAIVPEPANVTLLALGLAVELWLASRKRSIGFKDWEKSRRSPPACPPV